MGCCFTTIKMHASLNVSEDVAATYKAIKMKRAHPWMFATLNEEKDTVIIGATGEKGTSFPEAWEQMRVASGEKPGVFILDHDNKLFRVIKCYDDMAVKEKMAHAVMSKQIQSVFDGCSTEVYARDDSDFTWKHFSSKI